MKKILMIATGGTIASRESESGLAPDLSADKLLSYIPEVNEICNVETIQIYDLDSTNVTLAHWQALARSIEDNYHSYDGFVICHGTDTLAYTAAALSYMIQNSSKPIVITGAQKPIEQSITDGKTNLIDSFLFAADSDAHGVCVVFNGKVIAGTRARKDHAFCFDAFSSINFPYLATIQNGSITHYVTIPIADCEPVFFYDFQDSVCILKLTPGIKPDYFTYLFEHYDGIIIEGFGVGGLPESLVPSFFDLMSSPLAKKKLIVMATQVIYEGTNLSVYEVGKKVSQNFDVVESLDMTVEAAFTKVMWILGQISDNNQEHARELFYQPVHFDIARTK